MSPVRAPSAKKVSPSAKKVTNPRIDDDEAGKDQGNRKPGFCVRTACSLGPLRRRTFERGDIVRRPPSDRMCLDIGGFADPAHLGVIAAIDEMDGGVRGLSLRHLRE